MTVRTTTPIRLVGGLDVVSTPMTRPAGRLLGVKNYEGHPQGYKRIDGYECFDGHPKPSEASYWVLNFDAGTATISEGDTVTGATSGATGKALVDAVVSSGTYGTNDAAGYLVLTAVSGTFQDNENLQVSAVTKCVANDVATERGADNSTDDTDWLEDAIETARALIDIVPGSGPIRGIWAYNGTKYAFRDNAGATACALYKSTTAGWTAVSLGYTVPFTSGGTYEPSVGQVATGASSAVTFTITGIVVTSGDWTSGDAAGYFTLASASGALTPGENIDLSGGHSNVATITTDKVAITLTPGGRYEFVNHNFGGSTDSYRMYGCDGVNKAFQFDGTTYVPITTGMTTDTPIHICAHRLHLFLAFRKGSLQNSSLRDPLSWDVLTDAGEIGIGEEITGLLGPFAGNMVVFGANTVAILYGSDNDTWDLQELSHDSGAQAYTAQIIGNPIYMDDGGIRDLATTTKYGDFNLGTLSELIDPILTKKAKDGITPVASVRVRSKDHYRLFFTDDSFISIYFGRTVGKGGPPECYVGELGVRVYAICAAEETESGSEILLFGSDDGMVYQLDAGTSFDGEAMEAFVRLSYFNDGSPNINKAWKGAKVELYASPQATLAVVPEFDYGDPDVAATEESLQVVAGGGVWDISIFDQFYYDSPEVGTARCAIEGEGPNVSLAILSGADAYEDAHVLSGITYQYAPRGLKRVA